MTEPLIERFGLRFLHVVGRNFLVWRKVMYASMIGNIADPMIYLVGLGFGLSTFMQPISGMPYISFLAGGMLCYSAMNSATQEALYSAFSRLKLQRTWEGILHAPMTAADVVIGEWIWAALKATLSGAAMLLAMYLLGIAHGLRPLAVMPVVLLLGLAFSGLGLIMTAFARTYEFFIFYFTLVISPMMFLSGVFYPRTALPNSIQVIGAFLPLTHGADLARGLTLGMTMVHPWLDVLVLAAYATGGLSLAVLLVRRRLLK